MLGQAISPLDPIPRRWLTRRFGILRINIRQTWQALWPHLQTRSSQPLHLLDAGCGDGRWSLELALLHPHWRIVGIDKDKMALGKANRAQSKLGVDNIQFLAKEFLTYAPTHQFDLILSVGSAHYLAGAGQGDALFERFSAWLRPDGQLLLLGPRCRDEVPISPGLPFPQWHEVFSKTELRSLCEMHELEVVMLDGSVGKWGTLAKQLSWLPGIMKVFTYPLQLFFNALDKKSESPKTKSAAWLLVARRK